MLIRNETPQDGEKIEQLTLAAFENHPHHDPEIGTTEHLIIHRLRQSGALTLSLVAEDETGIIGHIAFSPITIDGQALNWQVLAPLSVLPSRQGQGIGSQLVHAALPLLKARGIDGVVVLGEPSYYTRFGFSNQHHLSVAGVPPDYFLSQQLAEKRDIQPKGVVNFHHAFDE